MSEVSDNCRICGWPNALKRHLGSVDCLNDYRTYVEELRSQLPRGKQVMVVSLERSTDAQLWIEGEITFKGLSRLITFIEFMREAWTNDEPIPEPETKETDDAIPHP